MIKKWFHIIFIILIISNYERLKQSGDLNSILSKLGDLKEKIEQTEIIDAITDGILFQVGSNEDGSIREVFYNKAKNFMEAINEEGKLCEFDLNKAGYRITGYGLGQSWHIILLANNDLNQTFIKVEIGSVIDRWTNDENKACWGVKEIYLYFDGMEFKIADQAEYISYIDREENSWIEEVIINQISYDSLELLNKYKIREDTTYFIE